MRKAYKTDVSGRGPSPDTITILTGYTAEQLDQGTGHGYPAAMAPTHATSPDLLTLTSHLAGSPYVLPTLTLSNGDANILHSMIGPMTQQGRQKLTGRSRKSTLKLQKTPL